MTAARTVKRKSLPKMVPREWVIKALQHASGRYGAQTKKAIESVRFIRDGHDAMQAAHDIAANEAAEMALNNMAWAMRSSQWLADFGPKPNPRPKSKTRRTK